MVFVALSDLGRSFVNQQANRQIREQIALRSQEVASGEAVDLTRKAGASYGRLQNMNQRLQMIGQYEESSTSFMNLLSSGQLALEQFDTLRAEMGDQMILVTEHATRTQLRSAVAGAELAFERAVSLTNATHAGRALFGGASTDQAALRSSEEILDVLKSHLQAQPAGSDLGAALDAWFEDPNGGFQQWAYLGDQDSLKQQTDRHRVHAVKMSATDPAVRDVLRSLAHVALSDGMGLTQAEQAKRISLEGAALFEAAEAMVSMQTRLGLVEAQVEQGQAGLAAERTALLLERQRLVEVDSYDAATELQVMTDQLEIHYTLTSRLSQLSLVHYL